MFPLSDEDLTEIFGPKCPDCGWRRGAHNGGGEYLGDPCPQWQAWAEACAASELWDAAETR